MNAHRIWTNRDHLGQHTSAACRRWVIPTYRVSTHNICGCQTNKWIRFTLQSFCRLFVVALTTLFLPMKGFVGWQMERIKEKEKKYSRICSTASHISDFSILACLLANAASKRIFTRRCFEHRALPMANDGTFKYMIVPFMSKHQTSMNSRSCAGLERHSVSRDSNE